VRVWTHHAKMKPSREHLSHSVIGLMSAEYSELYGTDDYRYTNHFISVGSAVDLLEELVRYYHHYCIIEITYHQTEYDMISHEMELILLLNHIF